MTDETSPNPTPATTEPAPKQPEVALKVVGDVTRDNIKLPVVEDSVKRGPEKGSLYYALDITKASVQDLCNFIGEKHLFKMLKSKIKQKSQQWTEAASTTTGVGDAAKTVVDLAEFLKIAADFAVSGESLDDLETERDTLLDELELCKNVDEMMAKLTEIKTVKAAIEGRKRGPRKTSTATEAKATA